MTSLNLALCVLQWRCRRWSCRGPLCTQAEAVVHRPTKQAQVLARSQQQARVRLGTAPLALQTQAAKQKVLQQRRRAAQGAAPRRLQAQQLLSRRQLMLRRQQMAVQRRRARARTAMQNQQIAPQRTLQSRCAAPTGATTCITGSMHDSGCGHPDCLSFDGLDVNLLWLPAPASASPALYCACIAQHCWLQLSLTSSYMFNFSWCWHGCRRQRRQQRPRLTCCASRSAP